MNKFSKSNKGIALIWRTFLFLLLLISLSDVQAQVASSKPLFTQLDVSVYDSENKLKTWMSDVKSLPKGSTLKLLSTDLAYIRTNLEAISVQKKKEKKDLRKALSLGNNQSAAICEDNISALKQMTSDYYIVLSNYIQE